jgi:hypothetical protein
MEREEETKGHSKAEAKETNCTYYSEKVELGRKGLVSRKICWYYILYRWRNESTLESQ